MKKHRLRLIGVMFMIIAAVFMFNFDVQAKKCDSYVKEVKSACNSEKMADYYKLELRKISKNNYRISIGRNISKKSEDTFVVTGIVGNHNYKNLSDLKVTKEKPLDLHITPGSNRVIKVELELKKADQSRAAKCLGKVNELKEKIGARAVECKVTGYIRETFALTTGDSSKNKIPDDPKLKKYDISDGSSSSDGYSGFESIRTEMNNNGGPTSKGKADNLKCDIDSGATTGPNPVYNHYVNGKKGEKKYFTDDGKYYTNLNYFYDSKVDKTDLIYHFNHKYDKPTEKIKNFCTRTCEEIVKVEYGPPVSTKAGLCFEYKVKITSYVKCTTDIRKGVSPKNHDYTYCSPVPECVGKSGVVHNQGGPNDDYEACIQSCDGGKYTRKCSDKCYQKVYKNSDKEMSYNETTSAQVKRLGSGSGSKYTGKECKDKDGCYYWYNNGGSVSWDPHGTFYSPFADGDADHIVKKLGRWYTPNYDPHWAYPDHHYYVLPNGIWKATDCGESCSWDKDQCTNNDYLNPSDASKDREANYEAYHKAKAECKAAASCTTKTAEVVIQAKYQQKGFNATVISYPYTKKETTNYKYNTGRAAKIFSKEKCDSNESNYSKDDPDKEILGYDGCYKHCKHKNWYQVEWSFPGTWMNNKNGELSYVDKHCTDENSCGWHLEKQKFCVPSNVQEVNTKWWEYDQVQKHTNSCFTSDQVKNSIEYNIYAKARKFGYFHWNFDISCFYAHRSSQCVPQSGTKCCTVPTSGGSGGGGSGTSTTNKSGTLGVSDYQFRIVNDGNMFPNENASKTNTGFNWTAGAKDTSNSEYIVDPVGVRNSIQNRNAGKKGDASIDDKYIEYKFVLTKEVLARLKDYTKNKKDDDYTNYDNGRIEVKKYGSNSRINFYHSPLLNATYGYKKQSNYDNARYKNYVFYNR